MEKPQKHILVCTSCRLNGVQAGACITKNSDEIVSEFLDQLEANELSDSVMVSNTGCFGFCSKGPVAVVYPDNVWYGNITVEDVEEIVEEHILNGNIVEHLLMD
ncbi:MAG: (2Fe-2S) ferredoxin domain-containing protein [Clostridiales bacterium]|nr:(2Fe-2S) ferredoxin domain-containing protein [Clostridiales bacterium]